MHAIGFSHRYAPLSVRLVQACVRPGWGAAAESLKLMPGPCVEVTQDPDAPPEDLPTAREKCYFMFVLILVLVFMLMEMGVGVVLVALVLLVLLVLLVMVVVVVVVSVLIVLVLVF